MSFSQKAQKSTEEFLTESTEEHGRVSHRRHRITQNRFFFKYTEKGFLTEGKEVHGSFFSQKGRKDKEVLSENVVGHNRDTVKHR